MGSTYSVLLMRDDQQVRRYRIHPFWFRFFVYLFAGLLLLSVGGVYATLALWQGNRALHKELAELRTQVQERDIRLASLVNVEKILAVYDPVELEALHAGTLTETEKTSTPASMDLKELFTTVSEGNATVEQAKVEPLEGGGLKLSFVLHNKDKKKQNLTGYAEVALVARDGRLFNLSLPQREVSFHFQNQRRLETSFSLPRGLVQNDIYAIRLEVVAEDGKTAFGKTYPLSTLLAH